MIQALIWDVDGTIAETERDGHLVAFNHAFEAMGLPWRWDDAEYGELLKIAGGRERLVYDLERRTDIPPAGPEREALTSEVHSRKNAAYAEIVAQGRIAARPGVLRLVDECSSAGVAMAVATTTSRANVAALFRSLWGPSWQQRFPVVVGAEDAPVKKPDPLVYMLALQRLGIPAAQAFALEDSPNGLHAALAAGLRCGVTRGMYFTGADFGGAAWVRDNLDAVAPDTPLMTLALLDAAGSGSIRSSPSAREIS